MTVAGHVKRLYVVSPYASCGTSKGPALAFENEGPWVIDLDELIALVEEAKAARAVDTNTSSGHGG